MLQASRSLVLLLLPFCMWAQAPSADKTETAAIQRVKGLLISSLDRNLPKITLEFFLKYEGEGATIQWVENDCEQQSRDKATDPGRDSGQCVQAGISLKDGRAATVRVLVSTRKRGTLQAPTVYAVSVTNPDGTVHHLDRLSDLPVELHRPLPKGPKDLPSPVSASAERVTDRFKSSLPFSPITSVP